MKILDGGAVENVRRNKIEEIRIQSIDGHKFELWINDSLSYLNIHEALQLKDEILEELEKSIKRGRD